MTETQNINNDYTILSSLNFYTVTKIHLSH